MCMCMSSFFDLKLGQPIALSETIKVNNKFFAVPWKCSGGNDRAYNIESCIHVYEMSCSR